MPKVPSIFQKWDTGQIYASVNIPETRSRVNSKLETGDLVLVCAVVIVPELVRLVTGWTGARCSIVDGNCDKRNKMSTGGENMQTHGSGIGWSFRDISELLPEFDPVKENIDITQWISKVEECGEIYGWDDVAIRHFGLAKLTGVARRWRDSLSRDDGRDWQAWKILLEKNFPCKKNVLSLRLEAQNYKKKTNQSIVEYFYEKLARCNEAKMDSEETTEWIVNGLNNNRYRDFLGPLSRYKEPHDLLSDLKAGSFHIRDNPPMKSDDFRKSDKKESDSGGLNCYTCKESGHIKRDCPKLKTGKCFKCGETGHFARDCGKKREKTSDTGSSNVVSTTSGSRKAVNFFGNTHQKYFKEAVLDGHPLTSYVDLGSGAVAIREGDAERIELKYTTGDIEQLVGYGHGVVKPIGVFKAFLTIDGVGAWVDGHVVPDEVQEVPLLVGHPYTEQRHVVITSRDGRLLISANDDSVPTEAVVESTKTVLRVNDSVIVPNSHVGHIGVKSDFKNTKLFVEGGLRESGHHLPRCVIQTDERGEALIPVLNLSGKEMKMVPGSTVARGEKCEEGQMKPREINVIPVTLDEVNTDLEGEKAESLLDLLNEYKDLVARNMSQLGCTSRMEMHIELENEKPVFYRPYRLSYSEREQTKDLIEELKSSDMVEDCHSPYASPILLIRKSSGEMRMCVDYRALNKLTVKDHYPIPRIDDLIDRMAGKKYFTTLDLHSGYHQVPVARDSRPKTAFVTPDGHYQFKRMPFGLCNAPAVFQRLMYRVLENVPNEVAMTYLDDTIVPSRTFEEGLANLRKVFDALRAANLTLKLGKCHFLKSSVEYLGFTLSEKGVAPGKRVLNAIRDFPAPTNVTGVRSFLGTANFCRRFVKGYAIIAKPLTDLTGKQVPFAWGPEQQKAFEYLKERLLARPVLAVYEPKAETEVHTDASMIGLGAVLIQKQEDNKFHPVSYYSRKTTKDESKYHSYELEALAIVCALERFRVYVLGIKFVIRTDCNSLKMLEGKRDLSPRIGRWFVRLSEFNYRIEYLKGVNNSVADGLSRNPVESSKEMELVGLPVMSVKITTDWIAAMQRGSDEIMKIRDKLEAGDQLTHKKFTMINARVYRVNNGKFRLYVPIDLRHELVAEAHRGLAHLGVDKTLGKLKETYYFPKMREFVEQYVKRCINCLYYKKPSGKKPGFLHPLEKGNAPFQCVHIDHAGPFVTTQDGNKYVCAIICGFSKYTVLKAVKSVSAAETVRMVREFCSHYGRPERIISDRGTAFTALEFNQFCQEYEIQHVKIAAGTPRGNGQVERQNRVFPTCLATITEDEEDRDWDEKLLDVQWAINNSVHRIIKRTPYEVVFTQRNVGLLDNPLTREIVALNRDIGLEEEQESVEELLEANRAKMQEQFDKKRKIAYEYQQFICVKNSKYYKGGSRKITR